VAQTGSCGLKNTNYAKPFTLCIGMDVVLLGVAIYCLSNAIDRTFDSASCDALSCTKLVSPYSHLHSTINK
jgi:hypothetical protein